MKGHQTFYRNLTVLFFAVSVSWAHAQEPPEVVKRFHSIIISDNWDRPEDLKPLIRFPITVTQIVYLSGECDNTCSRFRFDDYESFKRVLRSLHEFWTAKPRAGFEKYAPSPFGETAAGAYGMTVMGDCSHSYEVKLGKDRKTITSVSVDNAGLADDASVKPFFLGSCEQESRGLPPNKRMQPTPPCEWHG